MAIGLSKAASTLATIAASNRSTMRMCWTGVGRSPAPLFAIHPSLSTLDGVNALLGLCDYLTSDLAAISSKGAVLVVGMVCCVYPQDDFEARKEGRLKHVNCSTTSYHLSFSTSTIVFLQSSSPSYRDLFKTKSAHATSLC